MPVQSCVRWMGRLRTSVGYRLLVVRLPICSTAGIILLRWAWLRMELPTFSLLIIPGVPFAEGHSPLIRLLGWVKTVYSMEHVGCEMAKRGSWELVRGETFVDICWATGRQRIVAGCFRCWRRKKSRRRKCDSHIGCENPVTMSHR